MPGKRNTPDEDAPVVYRFRLKDGVGAASFMADTKAVELTEAEPQFETTDRLIAGGLRGLDFLEEVAD